MNASNESSIVVSNDTITQHRDILQISSAAINLVLGVPANGWVLWLVFTGPAGTMASDFFTLNLSACEIIFSLLYLPAMLVVKPDVRLLSLFISGLLFTGRPLFQTCIVVERFLAVVHPVLYLRSKPLRYRAACSAAAWLLTAGFSLLYMLAGFTEVLRYVHVGKCLFFMSVMLWCSVAVLRALRRPVPGETAAGRERERESRDGAMKRRAFTVICLIMGSFLGSFLVWTVFAILAEQEGLLREQEFTLVIGICMVLSVVTGFVQPLLYLCHKTGKLPCGVKPVQDP